jgi:hypothetical protein
MPERFVVSHSPVVPDKIETQTFTGKGLAFAYAMKRVPRDRNGGVSVQRQITEGRGWRSTDTWKFFADGNMEHRRCEPKET